ncbi:MAG: glycine/sarcosine/betaine reductase selenoprotein B family protein [Vicinamibacterales bacterium]
MYPSDLPFKYRFLLRTYRWRAAGDVPAAVLARPIAQARVALVTSAGLTVRGDRPFDISIGGGDWSFRTLPRDRGPGTLEMHHKSDAFDAGPLGVDPNVVFPLDRLRAMAEAGEIGDVAPRHLSFMGSITAPARLVAESAPAAAEVLAADGVEAALLVPV